CQTCHGPQTWAGATVDHLALSGGFALVGAHVSIACTACHTGPSNEVPWNPSGQDDCQSCHAEDAAAVTDPSHAGFPATCTTCHSTQTWGGAVVDHPALSGGFGLAGAHAVLACQTCHTGPGNEVPWTPADQNDCQSCHADDAAAATPSHNGFPSTCTSCHGTGTWAGATVDHVAVSGGYPLVGAHNALPCGACHSGPGGALPWSPSGPDDCFACHASDYQTVHAGSGFPTTCSECHGTTTWGGATFAHDDFPIYSGDHAGEWASCQTCHTQPGQPQVFTCLTCHEHSRDEMDDEHEDEDDYVYNSQACYNCHPDGRADDRALVPRR
ncbi:MAG TPA: cytochrome c3 family protein, partial [Rubricoccaceae bacterium]